MIQGWHTRCCAISQMEREIGKASILQHDLSDGVNVKLSTLEADSNGGTARCNYSGYRTTLPTPLRRVPSREDTAATTSPERVRVPASIFKLIDLRDAWPRCVENKHVSECERQHVSLKTRSDSGEIDKDRAHQSVTEASDHLSTT